MLSAIFGAKLRKGKGNADAGTSGADSPSRRGGNRTRIVMPVSAEEAAKPSIRQTRSQGASDLIQSMNDNMASMRHKFADVEGIQAQLKLDEVKVQDALDDSIESNKALRIFHEEMEGDFELMKHKPMWIKAVDSFQAAALGEKKDVEATTDRLATYLCEMLAVAEPGLTPQVTALVGRHPLDSKVLKVYTATDACAEIGELKPGSTLRLRAGVEAPSSVAGAWTVMHTGQPELHNAHGLERDSKVATSIAPLKSMNGRTFAALVSGPPAVPDELLETLTRFAGPLMERVWKKEMAAFAIGNVQEFIKDFAINSRHLIYVSYEPGAFIDLIPDVNDDEHSWRWQPLKHTDPKDANNFVLSLAWRLGEPIGVLRVKTGTFTEMSETLLVLLHTIAVVLEEAIDIIEGLSPGDPPPLFTTKQVMFAFEEKRKQAGDVLRAEIMSQLQYFDASKVFGEIKSLDAKVIDDDTFNFLQAALVLMGVKKSSVTKWSHMQSYMKNPRNLKVLMEKLSDKFGDTDDPRWDELRKIIEPIDLSDLDMRSSAPLKILIRWVNANEMAHNVALAIEKELAMADRDPMADQVFDTIDIDGDQFISMKELVKYMLTEFDSTCAHRLLRVLDTDNDHKVSRAEWHKGWNAGVMTTVLEKAKEAKEAGGQTRLIERRRGGAMALTAAAAARMHEEKMQLEQKNKKGSAKGGSSKFASKSTKADGYRKRR